MCVYLRPEFQVSSNSNMFQTGGNSSPPQNRPLKSPSSLGLTYLCVTCFFILKTTCFNGYDYTLLVVRDNTTNVIKAIEQIGENLIIWFSDNQINLNTDKCHVLLNSQGRNTIKMRNLCMNISSCEIFQVYILTIS